MNVQKYGYLIEQPNIHETGNVYCKAPESRKNIIKLMEQRNLKGFIEPNVGQTATLIDVKSLEIANELHPWAADYTRCDALRIPKKILKENNYGVLARSADCMMLALISKEDVFLLHLSVQSINNGILEILKKCKIDDRYTAVGGVCISSKNYFLYGEEYIKNMTCNFKKYGYDKFVFWDESQLHIDIRGIARYALEQQGIKEIVFNNKCTFEDLSLGSNRREGPARHDNVMIIRAL